MPRRPKKAKNKTAQKIWGVVGSVLVIGIAVAVAASKIIRLNRVTDRIEERERQAEAAKNKTINPNAEWTRIGDADGVFSAWMPPGDRNTPPDYQDDGWASDTRPRSQQWHVSAGGRTFFIFLSTWSEKNKSLGEPDSVARLDAGEEPTQFAGRKAKRSLTTKMVGLINPSRQTSAVVHVGLGNGRSLRVSVTGSAAEFNFDDPVVVKFLSGFTIPAAPTKK